MIRQKRMQFGVMLSIRARDVESGLHFTSSIREPSIECDVKDVIEIEIDRIERRQICESIKRPAERLFLLPDETYYVINERFAQEAVDFNDLGSLRARNIKRTLYRFATGIGKAPVKSEMKNIFEG